MPPATQAAIDRITQIVAWLTHRWTLSALPPSWLLLVLLATISALVIHPRTWPVVRHGATIVHEMGHVSMGWLWGRKVQGISLHSDTSGLTITAGKERGVGVLMTYLAGYPAPALTGLALVWAATSGYSGAALTLVMALLLLAFWLVRNLFGLAVLLVALLGAGLIFWDATPALVTGFTLAAGIFLLAAGTRTCIDLRQTHQHGDGAESDASMAAAHSLLPPGAWVYFFIGTSLACALQSINVIVSAAL